MKTNSLFKRLVSMLIVVLMICTLFPVTALAKDPPQPPTEKRLYRLLDVTIYCQNVSGGDTETYHTLIDGTYEIGEVTGNEKDGYTCSVTINSDGYIQNYSNTRWPSPIAHELAENEDPSKTVTLVYEYVVLPFVGGQWLWYLADGENGTIQFDVVHEKTYTLSYDAKGGTGTFTAQQQTVNVGQPATFTIYSTKPTKDGYEFKGWATSETATSATYQPGNEITITANTILYAVWEENQPEEVTYTLKYNANDGSTEPFRTDSKTNRDGKATFTIITDEPTRVGYTFKGWSTSSSGAVEYKKDGEFKNTFETTQKDNVLYAVWEKNAPTYDELNRLFGNSAVTILCTNTEAKHNPATYGLLPNSENENDSYSISKPQKDKETGVYTCVITVYADPYVKQYSTDIRKEHSLDDDKSKTITLIYNDDQGWYVGRPERATAPALAGVTFNVVCKETPVTTYTVTYKDGVGGKVFKDDVHTVKSGATTPAFVGGIPTRPGYVFVGWTPTVSKTVTGNATYTATWRKVKDTTVIEIGGGNSSSSSSKEENPNTGAPVFVGVSVGALAAAK